MTHTFFSPIAQQNIAYDLGYRSGFNQEDPDTRTYKAGGILFDKYWQGRRDGIADLLNTATRTGVK